MSNLSLFCAYWIPVGEERLHCHFSISSTLCSLVRFFTLPGYSSPSFSLKKMWKSIFYLTLILRDCSRTEHKETLFVSTFMNKFLHILIRDITTCSLLYVEGWKNSFFFLLINLFYLFLAVLSLYCCTQAFSSCGEWGLLFVAVLGLLIAVAPLVAEHGL